MLTDAQREIFTKLLDVNFQHSEAKQKANSLNMEVNMLKDDLREAMGDAAYEEFMNKGMKMFA